MTERGEIAPSELSQWGGVLQKARASPIRTPQIRPRGGARGRLGVALPHSGHTVAQGEENSL